MLHQISWFRRLPPPIAPLAATWLLALSIAGCGDTTAPSTTGATPAGATDNASADSDGASPSETSSTDGPVAVCTTGMVAELVRAVAGGHVQVESLMGEGVDPHLYKPTPPDVSRIARADLVFYSGLHLEGKMLDPLNGRAGRGKPTRAVTEKLEHGKDARLFEVEDGLYDPHVWFDLEMWGECSEVVAEALSEFQPEHAAEFGENAERLRSELADLMQYGREQIGSIPENRRVLVTAHDAFEYFGRAFDIKVEPIQGVSTEAEAGVGRINELVEYIATRGVKAVFVESSVSDRNIKSLIEGCAVRDHEVRIGGELYSDALGPEGTPAGTFTGMVRHNIDTIVSALK